MQSFAQLFQDLDSTSSTSGKLVLLTAYFKHTAPQDAVWSLYLLLGRKQKRLIQRRTLEEAIGQVTGLAPWLVQESYAVVGDLAETIALLLPEPIVKIEAESLHVWMEKELPRLSSLDEQAQIELLSAWWKSLDRLHRFLLIKLITGGFRMGVARNLIIKAMARAFEQSETSIAERLSGNWPVTAEWYEALRTPAVGTQVAARGPLPFYLASPFDPELLGTESATDFSIEWKWDGIRAQLIKRGSHIALWSRGEEVITENFPDIIAAAQQLADDLVLDGELLIESEGRILPFSVLQTRINRKKPSTKILAKHPAIFLAFDCLEHEGRDLRDHSQRKRRQRLEAIIDRAPATFRSSPLLPVSSWEDAARLREEAKARGVEGLMLKRWEGTYKSGRKRGDWWKWKVDPMTLDAVLLYAQAGHGRRATLYTDYTFALWKEGQLVPFAKAYSGLTDAEMTELDRWIRAHTIERFGPVRSVEALRVFEIAFEGISLSPRHKSGIAVRFPRILRERPDKRPEEANTVEQALELIHGQAAFVDYSGTRIGMK